MKLRSFLHVKINIYPSQSHQMKRIPILTSFLYNEGIIFYILSIRDEQSPIFSGLPFDRDKKKLGLFPYKHEKNSSPPLWQIWSLLWISERIRPHSAYSKNFGPSPPCS